MTRVYSILLEVDGWATGGDGVDDLCGAKALHESSLLSSTLWSAGSDVSFFPRVAMSFGI